ncbi:MAG: prepilin peptidase [Acidobacteria bacterium]|nr:prepilin peptidase [Acidobacteriota bacterium]
MAYVAAILFGLVTGSFLNVCIYRIPRGRSIVRPRSACPHCGRPIPFFDNIPLVSYLILRGRCRHCAARISPQYPAVETLNGLLWLLCVVHFGLSLSALFYAVFASAMLVLAFIDVSHRILPHGITFGGLALAVASAPWQWLHQAQSQQLAIANFFALFGLRLENPWLISWLDSLLGVACGAGMLLVVAIGYFLVKKEEGMGHGDIVMMGFVGAVLGPQLAFLTILMGSFAGALVGVVLIQQTRDSKYQIPFGTFLGGAAVVVLFWGNAILHWYWDLI